MAKNPTWKAHEPIVLQAKDIDFASRTPDLNGKSSKALQLSPMRRYGFESVALNARVRRLPDGLSASQSIRTPS